MKTIYIFAIFTVFIFSLTVLILRWLIPKLTAMGAEQKILQIGPNWHSKKEGTPTMGGLSFILAGIISLLLFTLFLIDYVNTKELIVLINIMVFGVLNALIGIIDDVAKIRKRQNEGLTATAKFFIQSIFCVLFLILVKFSVGISTELTVPFLNLELDLGFVYYLIAYIVLIGVVNSVNLTDGIDGLASSIIFTIGVLFALIGVVLSSKYTVSFMGALLIGSSLGFLTYNFYPAKVFMGDTGSLYFGGIIAASSLMLDNILLPLLYGFMFCVEALSDILQVFYYKITKGKRFFKMAPIHHHFEKNGWSEIKIVVVFTVVNALFCLIAFWSLNL